MKHLMMTIIFVVGLCSPSAAQPSLNDAVRDAQGRIVKIYGGRSTGLEGYQSGFLVSPEGHVATARSHVLDVEPIVVLDDGRRFEAKVVGFEPSLELAVLKFEASGLPFYRIDDSLEPKWGDPVLAVSNLFGIATGNEPASAMQGSVAAITPLDARRGVFKTPYQGDVLVLDLIANNPGAAGGAVVDVSGNLIGMLGKELRDSSTGAWLNYAVPASALKQTIGDIIAGRTTTAPEEQDPLLPQDQSHQLASLGMVMVPDVLEFTPAFIDSVITDSPADKVGLRPDDLVLLVGGRRVDSQRTLRDFLRRIDRRDRVQMTIQRENEIIPLVLEP